LPQADAWRTSFPPDGKIYRS